MSYKVFIDGAHGTTGLRIRTYLKARDDIEIIEIAEDLRKDLGERVRMTKEADITLLCLPDDASRELAAAAPADVRLIDTSTAHRTDLDWVYGLPELKSGQREKIRNSTRTANPGCHATGFIVLAEPIVEAGIVAPDYSFDCFSVTGYSGGGKQMIEKHQSADRPGYLVSPGQYALKQAHKHLPEMVMMSGITEPPVFCPVVGDYFSGMVVTLPLHRKLMKKQLSVEELRQVFRDRYAGEPLIRVMDQDPDDGFVHSDIMSQRNDLEIFISGNDDRPILISRFDNLGKGASGAAVQNLNIMLGIEETKGLL